MQEVRISYHHPLNSRTRQFSTLKSTWNISRNREAFGGSNLIIYFFMYSVQAFYKLNEKYTNLKNCCLEWSEWSRWSLCTETCGEGRTSRNRTCLNLPPNESKKSDSLCPGEDRVEDKCSQRQFCCKGKTYRTSLCCT